MVQSKISLFLKFIISILCFCVPYHFYFLSSKFEIFAKVAEGPYYDYYGTCPETRGERFRCDITKKTKFTFNYNGIRVDGCPVHGFRDAQVKRFGKNIFEIERLAIASFGLELHWLKNREEINRILIEKYERINQSMYDCYKYFNANKELFLSNSKKTFTLFIISLIPCFYLFFRLMFTVKFNARQSIVTNTDVI